ncbi:MAG: S41 family peptidase [Lachnospiraceae bacterium]|nr:S41 family peptidase [Lachnospiraceae bacterium]
MDTFNRERSFRGFFTGLLFGLLFGALAASGFYFAGNFYQLIRSQSEQASAASQEDGESVVNADTIQKMKTIEEVINTYHYGDEISSGDLQEGVYKGMVKALKDPYAEYYTKDELEETLNSNQGISYGIGAAISLNKEMDTAMINSVIADTPAEAAGLREGDIIYKVDGEDTVGMSVSQVVSRVKGKENTTVHLTIYREGESELIEMDIVRGKLIEAETVQSGMLEDTKQIGYLRITEFDTITVDQFNEAMAELNASGMKALILDLRSNPGGDLTAVVDVARRLLPKGLVVYTEDKNGKRKEYTCDGEHEIQIPMAVLVNEYSASASEILSGAIKDYNKGTVIGTTTYGKGIVQRINRLDDGTAVKLTVSAYFTPLGKNIHGIGIEPDIELEYDYEAYERDGVDNQVEKAIEILEGKIE